MKTPFIDAVSALAGLQTRFFMPGHKGNAEALPLFASLLPYDLTEIEGADDLSHPSGPLLESEQNMAAVYGSGATLYSAAGSTSCILAMLALFAKPGSRLLMARGCHGAALRGLAFLDLEPVWVFGKGGGPPTPEELRPLLEQNPGVPVYLTSPDYYGRMADLAALAPLCHSVGSPLLVDNAHGAHLRFAAPDAHPITLGADGCADSAHKTLPCLTPAAMLHLREGGLKQKARDALGLFSSTSPAYPVLMSLDWAAGLLGESPPDFAGTARRLAALAAEFPHLVVPCDDPLRLCLRPAGGGWPAAAVRDALAQAGILPEYFDGQQLILMASPYNTSEDYQRLAGVLAVFPPREPIAIPTAPTLRPAAALRPRAALFATRERVETARAAGRVMAGLDAPCPPGVPLVVPGEVIGGAEAAALAAGGIPAVDVVK